MQKIWRRLKHALFGTWKFVLLVFSLYFSERGPRIAASLTYTTLLALVPLLAIGFAVFSRFPVFEELIRIAQDYFLEVLTPSASAGFKQQVLGFVAEARGLTQVGLVVLLASAILTLNTIDTALNDIWQVTRLRRVWKSIVAYFTILLVGPLLMGLSISVSTYIFSLPLISGNIEQTGAVLKFVPIGATLLAFTLMYKWVGALVATMLFEAAKRGFSLYLSWFPSYRIIYGALAAIPLTLIWLFLSWTVVLLGAQTAYCLSVFRRRETEHGIVSEANQRARISWRLLALFKEAAADGLDLVQIYMREPVADKPLLESQIHALVAARLIKEMDTHRWRWNPSNENLTISQLVERAHKIEAGHFFK